MSDITELKRALESRAQEVAEYLLPRGILQANEWCVGSTGGEAGESLKVRVRGSKVGCWSDFAANGESGDLIDLWQAVKHLSLVQALDDIWRWLGVEQPKFDKRAKA
jgi:twinkle protein